MLRCGEAREQKWGRGVAWRELGRGDAPRVLCASSGGAGRVRARACGVGGDQFPCPGGAVWCWEGQGAALWLAGRLDGLLDSMEQHGMATVRLLPGWR